MAFSNWDTYRQLLEKLTERRSDWSKSRTFTDFDEAIRARCSDVATLTNADGALEYDALLGELNSEFVDNKELVYEQLKLVAMAVPAGDRGLGPEWQGYFVSERADGQEVYSTDKFAAPSGWEKVEVSITALSLTHDPDTGLMYLGDDWFLKDGVTQVWEDTDKLTQHTLWRGYAEVGRPLAEPPVAEPPVAEPPVAESPVAEPAVVEPPVAQDQAARRLVEEIAVTRADVMARILEKVEQSGYDPQAAEAQIAAALDSLVLAQAASAQSPQ